MKAFCFPFKVGDRIQTKAPMETSVCGIVVNKQVPLSTSIYPVEVSRFNKFCGVYTYEELGLISRRMT